MKLKLITLGLVSAFTLAACNSDTTTSSRNVAGNKAAETTTNATNETVSAPAAPRKGVFTEEGLAELDRVLAETVDKGQVPGIAYTLVHKGETISQNHIGVQSYDTERPMQDDTIYRIYSMTKPVTGVAMMILWEEGKWDLDDPVTKHIPELGSMQVLAGRDDDGNWLYEPMERPPTMRELMTHTAGYAYGLFGNDPANKAFTERNPFGEADLPSFIEEISDIPLLFQPGKSWSYSAAVDIQGYVVEKLSGQPFGVFLEERIFAPLEMVDTGFAMPEEKHRLATIYSYNKEAGGIVAVPEENVLLHVGNPKVMQSGGGGLFSTLSDYKNFAHMLLNEGELNGARILKPETVRKMRENHIGDLSVPWFGDSGITFSKQIKFGMGVAVHTDPASEGRPFGKDSYYWGGAAGTWFWVDPTNELFFVGMVQRYRPFLRKEFSYRSDSPELVYQALE